MKYFRVKTGYGKDDFLSISEGELPTAFRAQITGKIGVFEDGTVAGNHIISIMPDYNRLMGWKRDYSLTGEDYEAIGNKTIDEYRNMLQTAKSEVLGQKPMRVQLREGVEKIAEEKRIS